MVKPERLLVEDPDAPRELREALEAARDRVPGEADMARLAAGFGFGLPPSLPPATPLSGASAAAGASSAKVGLLLKGAAVLGAASLVTVGALQLTAPRSATPSTPKAIPSALQTSLAALPSEKPFEPTVRDGAEPEAVKAPRVLPAPNVRSHREVRAPAPVTSAAPVEVPVDAPPVTEPEPPSDPASRLREEALLVRRAQSMLASDPAGALRLTAERRRQFPGGVLGQEASVVAIEALLRLGRRKEAEAQARAFEAAHPGSVHARRMRKLLEGR